MESRGDHDTYAKCKHIPKTYSEEITEEQLIRLPGSERGNESVLPLFERRISDYKRVKVSSLQTNEMLKCRWKLYIQSIEGKKHTPFQFPDLRDIHFHNSSLKFMPSLTIRNRTNLRKQMGMGPGVDQHGQMPIPNDMHVTLSNVTKTKPAECCKTKQN